MDFIFCIVINFYLYKTGPGRIRTYDQGIMSPLRYRCATSPYLYSIFKILGLAVAALPTSPKMIINHFSRHSATSPYLYSIFKILGLAVAALPTSPKMIINHFSRHSATSPFNIKRISLTFFLVKHYIFLIYMFFLHIYI